MEEVVVVDGQAMEEVVVDGQVMVSIFDKQIILRHRYQLWLKIPYMIMV